MSDPDPFPRLPRSFEHPDAIVLDGHEQIALIDAMNVYHFVMEGDMDSACAYRDQEDVAGYAKALHSVRAKIDHARAPALRQMRAWLDAAGEWEKRNGPLR